MLIIISELKSVLINNDSAPCPLLHKLRRGCVDFVRIPSAYTSYSGEPRNMIIIIAGVDVVPRLSLRKTVMAGSVLMYGR